jgi:2-methylcitrate dehydratase PrpD
MDMRCAGSSGTLAQLAAFALAWRAETMPPEAFERAGDVVVDCIAAAICGADESGAHAARLAATRGFGAGVDPIWFTRDTAPPAAALMANAAAASILDLDDGHRAAAGHPGAAIVPAVLAEAARLGTARREAAAAIITGYEIAVRMAAARDFSRLDTMSSGRWTHFGVVAALARLRGLSPEILTQALAIAGIHGPNQSASGYSKVMGSHTKEGIPWSALNGVLALDLAESGYSGPVDLVDHPDYYDAGALISGLGLTPRILGTYFKPYSCCRWAHAPIDALRDLMRDHAFPPEAIGRIEVATFARALGLANATAPQTLQAAQYSLPFTIALAALRGSEALVPMRTDSLADPAVIALAERLVLRPDPDREAAFPREAGACVTVETDAGTFSACVTQPRGEPANPMTRADLMDKLVTVNRGKPLDRLLDALGRYLADDGDAQAPAALVTALADPALAGPAFADVQPVS